MNQYITTTTYMRSLIYGHHQMIITAYISKWKVGSNSPLNVAQPLLQAGGCLSVMLRSLAWPAAWRPGLHERQGVGPHHRPDRGRQRGRLGLAAVPLVAPGAASGGPRILCGEGGGAAVLQRVGQHPHPSREVMMPAAPRAAGAAAGAGGAAVAAAAQDRSN
jgi:hypothetical protein